MKVFHLSPNDPRILNMTLEQRNFCIINMNEDNAERAGKTNDTTTDTDTSWEHVSEEKFNPVPDTVRGGTKRVLQNIGKKLGMGELQLEHAQFNHEKKVAPLRHSYRIRTNKAAENATYKRLLHRAKVYKKRGIDKSGEWDQYFPKHDKSNHYGFKI